MKKIFLKDIAKYFDMNIDDLFPKNWVYSFDKKEFIERCKEKPLEEIIPGHFIFTDCEDYEEDDAIGRAIDNSCIFRCFGAPLPEVYIPSSEDTFVKNVPYTPNLLYIQDDGYITFQQIESFGDHYAVAVFVKNVFSGFLDKENNMTWALREAKFSSEKTATQHIKKLCETDEDLKYLVFKTW